MKIDYLNEVMRIFGYYLSEDENLIREAAQNAFDYEPLILKFNDELQTNIVTNRAHALDVVKLYLQRLGRIAHIVQPDFLNDDIPETDTDKYFYYCSMFINDAFSMVQFNCRDFKIDFHKIMHELGHDELYSIIETFPNEPQNIESEITPLDPENQDHTKFANNQKYELLKDIGFFRLPIFLYESKLSQNSKHKILAKILNCDERTARAYFDEEPKYLCTPENKNKVSKFLNSLKNGNVK